MIAPIPFLVNTKSKPICSISIPRQPKEKIKCSACGPRGGDKKNPPELDGLKAANHEAANYCGIGWQFIVVNILRNRWASESLESTNWIRSVMYCSHLAAPISSISTIPVKISSYIHAQEPQTKHSRVAPIHTSAGIRLTNPSRMVFTPQSLQWLDLNIICLHISSISQGYQSFACESASHRNPVGNPIRQKMAVSLPDFCNDSPWNRIGCIFVVAFSFSLNVE